jgi:hypothetical protein
VIVDGLRAQNYQYFRQRILEKEKEEQAKQNTKRKESNQDQDRISYPYGQPEDRVTIDKEGKKGN